MECKREGAESNEVRDLTLYYHPSRNVWRVIARLTPLALYSYIQCALINPDATELYRVTYLQRRDAVCCASLSITSFLKAFACESNLRRFERAKAKDGWHIGQEAKCLCA